jgi:hypothetical protein
MTSTALDQLFFGAFTDCSICGVSIVGDKNLLNFHGEFEANVCGGCREDFKRQHGETIETRLAREKCFPGDIIRFRGGRPRS